MRSAFAILMSTQLVVVLFSSFLAQANAQPPAQLAVPKQEDLDQALTLIRGVYKTDWDAAKTQPKKKALAERLVNDGVATKDNLAGQYTLLRVGRDMAASVGDLPLAFQAIAALCETFDVDQVTLQSDALMVASKATLNAQQQGDLARTALTIADSAMAEDKLDAARLLCEVALSASKKTSDAGLIKQATARAKEMEGAAAAFRDLLAAQKTLESQPQDKKANEAVGRYRCLIVGDWSAGLSFLALSGDTALASVATREFRGAGTTEELLKLADDWWTIGETEADAVRERVRIHAAAWYREALPKLSGLNKARVEKRLAELGSIAERPLVTSNAKLKAMQKRFKPGDVSDKNGLSLKLCWCPAGKFFMGSPSNEPGRGGDEAQVDVELTSGFWLGQFEITQAEWKKVMGTTIGEQQEKSKTGKPVRGEGDQVAMYFLNFEECQEFCRKFTAAERAAGRLTAEWEYRLPTEAQWEYACRAGTTTATAFGEAMAKAQDNVNRSPNGPYARQALKVGSYPPNAWGLHDMHGNVCEWCRDTYVEKLPGGKDPVVLDGAQNRITRGGNWGEFTPRARSAFRGRPFPPETRNGGLGFRVAVVPSASK